MHDWENLLSDSTLDRYAEEDMIKYIVTAVEKEIEWGKFTLITSPNKTSFNIGIVGNDGKLSKYINCLAATGRDGKQNVFVSGYRWLGITPPEGMYPNPKNAVEAILIGLQMAKNKMNKVTV